MNTRDFFRSFRRKGRLPDRTCPVCGSAYEAAVRFCSRDGATLEDQRETYDAFVSYRRAGGSHAARLVRLMTERLSERKLFLDVDELGSGRFDERLLAIIESAQSFILILSPGSLDRCSSPDDWLRREILHALASRRKIIPVFVDGFAFPDESFLRGLPLPMADLPNYQAVVYDHNDPDSAVRKILRYMSEPATAPARPAERLPVRDPRPSHPEAPRPSDAEPPRAAPTPPSPLPDATKHPRNATGIPAAEPAHSSSSATVSPFKLPTPAVVSAAAAQGHSRIASAHLGSAVLSVTHMLQGEGGNASARLPASAGERPRLGSPALTITARRLREQGDAPSLATDTSQPRFLAATLTVTGSRGHA